MERLNKSKKKRQLIQSKHCAEHKHEKCDIKGEKLVCGKQGLISKQSKETM